MEEMSFSTFNCSEQHDVAVTVGLLDAGFGGKSPEVVFHLNRFMML